MTEGMQALPEEEILEEARGLICGDRNAGYGPAEDDFPLVARMFQPYLEAKYGPGQEFDAEDVSVFMVMMKLRRQAHRPKRDNLVDSIGYLALAHRLRELGLE